MELPYQIQIIPVTSAIPPGETIQELAVKKEIYFISDLAKELGITIHECKYWLNGHYEIDEEMAQCLEDVLGPPVSFWLNLERNYRKKLKKVNL